MATLEELRNQLDEIDNRMAELYQMRMDVCQQVGEYKVKAGRKVYDRQREKDKLADVASKVQGEFNKKGIKELYSQLMSMSRKLQYQQTGGGRSIRAAYRLSRFDALDKEECQSRISGNGGGLRAGCNAPVLRGGCELLPCTDFSGCDGGNRRRLCGFCGSSD